MSLLEIKNLKKVYTSKLGTNEVIALRDVNFTVEKGEYVAVMGESGSGKTTLLNILAALDKASSGEVRLDGMNLSSIRDSQISSLRRDNLGFVFQEFNLLDTFTLRDNIYLPRVLAGIKPSQMEAELKPIAEILGIEGLLDKYPFEVSGGQKQRISIARAILENPQILILDEATSALDNESEKLVQDALEELMKGKTTFVIAHRLSTIINSDKIVVIQQGEIKEIGTHEELLDKDGIYKSLYNKSFKN